MQVNTIEETVNTMVDEAGSQLKAIQEFLFTIMADVRMPLVEGIKFSRRQKKQVTKALMPGDIILTYSSGYLSNIFLPGYFKHALSFTGSQNIKKNGASNRISRNYSETSAKFREISSTRHIFGATITILRHFSGNSANIRAIVTIRRLSCDYIGEIWVKGIQIR